MEFGEKQKNLHLKHSHRGNPTSHGLFTKMEKKFKRLKLKIKKIDQANINIWLVKNFFG